MNEKRTNIKLRAADTEPQLRRPARKAPRRKCPKCGSLMIGDGATVDDGVIVRERCPDCGHIEEAKAR